MAETGDLKTVTYCIGTYAAAAGTIPVLFLPASHGAITIVSCYVAGCPASGPVLGTLELQKFTNAAAPLSIAAGTLGTLPLTSGTIASGGAVALTIATKIVSPGTAGCWVGYQLGGTITKPLAITLNYVQGRAG